MDLRDGIPDGAPNWVDLATSAPDAARAFYGALFGWTFEIGGPETGGYTYAFVDGAVVAGIIGNSPNSGVTDRWFTYLATSDADATVARVAEAGGTVAVAPRDVGDLGRMALIGDPGGGEVGLWQPGRHAGFAAHGVAGAPVWHELITPGFAEAAEFYTAVFGWKMRVEGDTEEFRYLTAEVAGEPFAGIMDGARALPRGTPARWELYFEVDDVDSTLAEVDDLGGTVLGAAEDSPYGRLATVCDTTGAEFRIMTPS